MWVARVIARAFGPFMDEVLEFGPGMNLVVGPNEAGKSTWHAATRLALTGVRRGRGRATAADAAIEARHRPWDGTDRWEVEARLGLADGRQIDISQDLAGKVACRAIDVDLGRDVSDEIMNGTPDASLWLGLDRDAFAATVSVSQGQIMAVATAENAEQLQEFMQRAAATRGTDATAAEAIDRLTEFRRVAVGADRVSAKGPLRAARDELAAATAALEDARARHGEYLERQAAAEEAGERVAETGRALATAEAAVARQAADQVRARLRRAEELSARHPRPPAPATVRDASADLVAAALDAWERRPHPPRLEGPDSTALEAALVALPPVPQGDRRPDASVLAASRALDAALGALRALGAEGPAMPPAKRPADVRPGPGRGAHPAWFLVAAGFLLVAGAASMALGALAPAAALLAGAAVAGAAGWASTASARHGREARAAEEVRARMERERRELGARRRSALEQGASEARAELIAALVARGASVSDDLEASLAGYLAACEARASQAERAARREPLERELAARRASEAAAVEAAASVRDAERALRDAARAVGGDPEPAPETIIAWLESWRRDRRGETERAERAAVEWQELQAVLDGATLDKLRAGAAALAAQAERLAAGLLPGAPAPGPSDEATLRARRSELSAAQQLAADLAGGLRVIRSDLPDVAEVEERMAAAEEELARVEALAATIDLTLRLLRSAQERVHRDLAPILADSVRRWLPIVSGGAYTEASVDPADLSVRVKEAATGQWRDARLLSEGTREQVYLLLRVAMAEHLVRPGEIAPLLLDEVTAQADSQRTRELLTVLHSLSAERQVILFSHDERVADWASAELHEPRDGLIRLPAAGAAPRPVATGDRRGALSVG